jgi:WD40 repeat protein
VDDLGAPPGIIDNSAGEVLGFALSPHGRLLATASSDSKVRLFALDTPGGPRRLATLGGFASYAYAVAFAPSGRDLIAGSADSTIRIWSLADPTRPELVGRPLSVQTGYVFALAVSPDGSTLAAASTAHAVWLWRISNISHPQLLATLRSAQDEVFTVQFDPRGGVLAASGSDNVLHLWDYQPSRAAQMVCTSSGDPLTRVEWDRYVQGASYRPPCA